MKFSVIIKSDFISWQYVFTIDVILDYFWFRKFFGLFFYVTHQNFSQAKPGRKASNKVYFSPTDSGRPGVQYERATTRPGTPLRLAGVFADGSKAKAPKYAQLIDPQGNVSRCTKFSDIFLIAIDTHNIGSLVGSSSRRNIIGKDLSSPGYYETGMNMLSWRRKMRNI